jgi:fructuronate reductase
VRGDVRSVDDPLAGKLAAVWAAQGEEGVLQAVLGKGGLLPSDWCPDVTYADLPRLGEALP